MQHGNDDVPWDMLSVGATRPAVIKTFNVPFLFIIPIMVPPILLMCVTRNPFWMALIAPLTLLGRRLVARDHNRPRVLWLALQSGAMFGDRAQWGGVTTDPLGTSSHAL